MSPISWTTPRTWAAGETITAALLNTHLRDNLLAIGGAWTSYTPTLAQGTATNISKTVNYAKYRQSGKTVDVVVNLTATGAGASGTITVSLPATAAFSSNIVGPAIINDYGTAIYSAIAVLASSTTVKFLRADAPSTTGNYFGSDPSMTIAPGDQVYFCGTFEIA